MSYYDYDEKDIAKTLKKAIMQGASKREVKILNDARNRKIASGGQALKTYEGDWLTKQADEYVSDKLPFKTNVDKLYNARLKAAAKNLKIANEKSKSRYERDKKVIEASYDLQRQELENSYRKNALKNEEELALMGLGRGAGNKSSSGFGESSRVSMLSNFQNNMADYYASEEADKSKAREDYYESVMENQKEYNLLSDGIYKDKTNDTLAQAEKDRSYEAEQLKANRDYNLKNQEIDNDKEDGLYEKALNAFVKTGIVENEEQASLLGIPVGTKSITREELEREADLAERKFISSEEEKAYDRAHPRSSYSSSKNASSQAFANAFKLFESVGYVINQDMADILGIPVGTEYYKYTSENFGDPRSYFTNPGGTASGGAITPVNIGGSR